MTTGRMIGDFRRLRRVLLWSAILMGSVAGVAAAPPELLPTTRVREEFFAQLPPDQLSRAAPEPRIATVPGQPPVLIRVEDQNDHRYYSFVPVAADGRDIAYPGAFIVKQRRADGAFVQIKVFLQRHEGAFLRLHPGDKRSTLQMELQLAGVAFYRNVNVPLTMERAIVAPVSEIRDITDGIVDWRITEPDLDAPGYAQVEQMVAMIRPALADLPDAEDGAMDADGRLVFIESLEGMDNRGGFNCSGFAKWVVDGLYEPLTGTYLPVEPLRRKHLDYRGTRWSRRLEDTRDPYFGLDWTRNLALHLHAAQIGHNPVDLDPESRDVRAVAVARYREDVGYPLADLPSVLYWLAAIDPGTIYLGSVNRPLGDEVVIRQHSHVVVFFPFFDQNGRFRSVVMERNVETDVASLQRRYEDGFVHLVRLETGAEFRIPQFVDADEPLLLR